MHALITRRRLTYTASWATDAARATSNGLGTLHHHQGRIEEARAHYDWALAIARELWRPKQRGRLLRPPRRSAP